MTRVAIVGLGRWGKNLLRVFQEQASVTVVCNRKNRQAQEWLKEHAPEIRHTFDYQGLLSDPDIDAVVLATPIATHAALARKALQAGKHVFVEKPLATDSKDADQLDELSLSEGRVLFTGNIFLYHPVLRKLQELTQDDPVRFLNLSWLKWGTFQEDLLWDLASHEVAIAQALFASVPESLELLAEQGVVTSRDLATVRMQFSKQRSCLLTLNRCASNRVKSLFLQTEKEKSYLWEAETLWRLGEDRTLKPLFENKEEPLQLEVSAFLNRIKAGNAESDEASRIAAQSVHLLQQLETEPVECAS